MCPPDSREHGGEKLLALLALAFTLRLVWGQFQSTTGAALDRLPDQREYLQIADNVLRGNGFRFYDGRFGATVVAFRTPGYPLFLAACGGSLRLIRTVQAVVDTSTVLAAYILAQGWLGRRLSLLSAGLVALNPYLIYMSGLVLSETVYTSALAWGMVLLLGSGARTVLGTGVLAVSVIVRPSGAGLPVLLMIAATALNRADRGSYSRWWPTWWPLPPATTTLVMILAVLLPWAARNDKLLGTWVWTTTNSGITAYDGFNDDATGASDQRFAGRVAGLRDAGEAQRDLVFADAARNWVRRHPRQALELAVIKAARTWSPLPLSADYGRSLYRVIGALYAVPFDLMIIVAVAKDRGALRTLPKLVKAFLLLPAIYFTAVHAASVGSLRYRLPAEPPMAVLAAVGCHQVLSRGRYRLAGSTAGG